MTINDIMLEQRLDKIRDLDSAWSRFEAEAHELDAASRPGLRVTLASAFVRFGVWIDHRAGERMAARSV